MPFLYIRKKISQIGEDGWGRATPEHQKYWDTMWSNLWCQERAKVVCWKLYGQKVLGHIFFVWLFLGDERHSFMFLLCSSPSGRRVDKRRGHFTMQTGWKKSDYHSVMIKWIVVCNDLREVIEDENGARVHSRARRLNPLLSVRYFLLFLSALWTAAIYPFVSSCCTITLKNAWVLFLVCVFYLCIIWTWRHLNLTFKE